jgi:hypothetical protein
MSEYRFGLERIRLQRRPHTEVRQQFPVCWNLLTDEQHRLRRRGYLLRDTDDGRLAGVVVVQFDDSPGGCRIWLTKLEVARHQRADADQIETLLLQGLQAEVAKWGVPLLVLSIPEYTDFLRSLGFVAWRLHRAVAVPATHVPPEPDQLGRADPAETTTETTAPPRISDCWAMLWMPPEPELQDN